MGLLSFCVIQARPSLPFALDCLCKDVYLTVLEDSVSLWTKGKAGFLTLSTIQVPSVWYRAPQ
jgi:hypothetical protein